MRYLWFFTLSIAVAVSTGHAQVSTPLEGAGNGNEGEVEPTRDFLFGDENENSLITAFNGWQSYYVGYARTPILFDPRTQNTKRLYPELEQKSTSDQVGRESLVKYNLGVDRALNKANMVRYRPLHDIEADTSQSENFRDNYLDLYESVLGVANLTLAYLNPTVAASLATTKNQTQLEAQNHILQQILWVQKEMSDPAAHILQRDVDEKVEYCLRQYDTPNVFPPTNAHQRERLEPDDCERECGPPPSSGPREVSGKIIRSGMFRWCVCCSAVTARVNLSTTPKAHDNTTYKGYSIWDRVLYGTDRPNGASANNEYAAHMERVRLAFRSLYGDVLLGPRVPEDGSFPAELGIGETPILQFYPPAYSVPATIKLFRDGLNALNGTCSEESGTSTMACPMTGTTIQHGIYNAIVSILRKWPPDSDNLEELKNLWVEASLGVVLSARDFKDMLELPGGGTPKLPDNWEPKGALRRWLNDFADASAVAAFKRLHLRMMVIAEDHMSYNMYASETEKEQVRKLMQRVSDQLNRAEVDIEANRTARFALAAMQQEVDRMRESRLGALTQANRASVEQAQQAGGFTSFGNFTKLCRGAGCSGGSPSGGATGEGM